MYQIQTETSYFNTVLYFCMCFSVFSWISLVFLSLPESYLHAAHVAAMGK